MIKKDKITKDKKIDIKKFKSSKRFFWNGILIGFLAGLMGHFFASYFFEFFHYIGVTSGIDIKTSLIISGVGMFCTGLFLLWLLYLVIKQVRMSQ